MTPPTTRMCRKCGDTKELSLFRKRKSCHYGYSWICLECERQRQRKYVANNKEKIRLICKKYRACNQEYFSLKKARYRKKHKDTILAKGREMCEKATNLLLDPYVKALLRHSGITEHNAELIEFKREQLKLYRALKEAKNGITRAGD